ncbi:MAG: hypothetical protein IJZ30_02245 [Alphaproteobacteria bacterium]|nr:hypothetical protein [Alphaproteobacteria bacterium]
MPYLTVYTNVDFGNSKELVEDSAKLISSTLSKPINYVVTNFIYNPNMSFGGSVSEKGALVELLSIGLGDKDRLVADITSFLAKNLDIKNTQNINISLNNAPASQVASGGYTFG